MRERLQRSSGTAVTPRDLLRTWKRRSREAASAADIAAIDRGDGRAVFCFYRGLYGSYPRRFERSWLDLTAGGPLIRPMLFLRFLRQRIPISEPVVGARVRPFESHGEAFRLGGAGQYAAGGVLEQSGTVVISCETSGGLLEFAVRRPDIDLVLHFFERLAQRAPGAASAEDA